MNAIDSEVNQIADLCWSSFNSLGKRGKPDEKSEYTVLAAVVYEYKNGNNLNNKKVVALSTGTKCYPSNTLPISEGIIDCHAEALLKRAFKRHLISDLKHGFKNDNNIAVTLFISQLPCGCLQRWKGFSDTSNNPNNTQSDYQKQVGVDRKPGRGVFCPKPSCIKKIAKWNYLGLQGKQLIQLTKAPVYINNIVIGNCGEDGEYDQQMLTDMLSLNDNNCITYRPFDLCRLPSIKFCQQFRNHLFMKTESKRSSSTAIVMWLEGLDGLEGNGQIVTEVISEGRKHGLTKKNMSKHQLLISDYSIHKDIELIPIVKDSELSDSYQSQWDALKKCALFKEWPVYSLPE